MGELAPIKIHPSWILPVMDQIKVALCNIDSKRARDVQCLHIVFVHEVCTRDGIAAQSARMPREDVGCKPACMMGYGRVWENGTIRTAGCTIRTDGWMG
jgi:hypothetical protein